MVEVSKTNVVAIASASWIFYKLVKRLARRSTLANVRGPPSDSWLFGNLARVYDFNAYDTHRSFEEQYGSVMKFYGILGEEQLYISDPEALYNIFIKEQDVYVNPEEYYIVNNIHFGNGIFSSQGDNHRRQRKLLSPAFSIAHMRTLTPIFQEVVEQLVQRIKEELSTAAKDHDIDLLNYMTRTALELIGQAGLGYSFGTLSPSSSSPASSSPNKGEPSTNTFARAVKELFTTESKLLLSRQYILPLVAHIGTPGFRRWVVDFLSDGGLLGKRWGWRNLREVRDILDLFWVNVEGVFYEKRQMFEGGENETVWEERVGRGRDVVSTLMRANRMGKDGDGSGSGIEDSEVMGHSGWLMGDVDGVSRTFDHQHYLLTKSSPHSHTVTSRSLIFAAMDTTSSAMAACFHMLAKNQSAQDRLRAEIFEAEAARSARDQDRNSEGGVGGIDYDVLSELVWLDAVCRETLRLYPPVSTVYRKTSTDAHLPLSKPIIGHDGQRMNSISIPANTSFIVSILSCNRHLDLWGKDGYEWKPERWLTSRAGEEEDREKEEERRREARKRVPGVYSNLMTFLGGGHACLGFKFSQLEMKMVVYLLIRHFKFDLSPLDGDVVWQTTDISAPYLRTDGERKSKLPLVLSVV